MELSFADVLTDQLKITLSSIREQTREMFKNKKPYRAIKVTDEERIANYLSITPDIDAQLSNDFGQNYQNYKQKMEDKIGGYKNA